MFKPLSTRALRDEGPSKTLLYAHHGWGKTTQAKYYAARFGKGLIVSGEAGLRSLMFEDIEYVPFLSWDGLHDPAQETYSFRGITSDMRTPEFKKRGYKWVMIDSWTEVSERLLSELEAKQALDLAKKPDKKKDGYALWGEYNTLMLGAAKWIRDLPYHILVTALAKEEEDDNGRTDYWPALKGAQVGKALPGIFDNVFGGVRVTSGSETDPQVTRYIVTDQVRGWHGKVRDQRRRVKPVEECDDITTLLERIAMSDADFEVYERAMAVAAAAMSASIPTTAAA